MVSFTLISLVLLVLVASFVCSLIEAVLLSLNPLELRLSGGNESSIHRWLGLKSRIEQPIAAILFFNCVANTGLATLTGALFVRQFGAEWLGLFSLGMTVAILFGSEMAPKILGVHHAARLAGPLLPLLDFMMKASHPVVVLMEKFCQKLKGDKPASHPDVGGHGKRIMDIITLVQAAHAEQAIHNREEIIMIHAATLSARRVRSVMVPATSVALFHEEQTLRANVTRLGRKLHRSYPVSRDGSLHSVVGYIRVRELFVDQILAGTPEPQWTPLIRPVPRVEDSISLTQLLASFLENNEIAALVVNSTGHPIGWITLDDVTETLMGARG